MKCSKCDFESPADTKFCSNCGTQHLLSEGTPVSQTKTIQVSEQELTVGSTFAGRYGIIEELGRGGMGTVYKVIDNEIQEKVALKLLKPEIAADKKMVERFRNELKFARKITHKNVCRMFDFSKEKGTPYITMEYVPGEDLKTSLRRMGPLSLGKTIFMIGQVCEGLAEAHKLGVVHRDLKPQNIMVDKEGNAHILDFGIARSLDAKGITGTGVMIGTPDYMSPEQVEGKEIDQCTDIYSLGVILYEMVTGKVPFVGDTPFSIALKHKMEVPRDPRKLNAQVSVEISRVILKCMEKDRNKRYQTAEELAAELRKIEEDLPTTERLLSKKKTKLKTPRKRFQPFAVAAILLFVAAIIVGGYFFYDQVLQKGKKEKEMKPAVIAGQTIQETPAITTQSGYIEINSTPEEAEVYIDEKSEGMTPVKRELPPGTYRIRITKSPEYEEMTDVMEIKTGETFSKNYTLIPQKIASQPGYMEITSTPKGAEVYVDSRIVGITPIKHDLNPGTYRIRIKRSPEYKEMTDVLVIKAGETSSKNYNLALVYILKVNTAPEGADVRIDGNYKGKTPIQLELPRSICQLGIEKGKEWSSIDERLTLKPGLNSIQRSLERLRYSLSVRTNPSGARVFIGNKPIGISPVKTSNLFGVYEIKIEKEGYKTTEESIIIESDIEKTYDLIKPEVVKIRLKVHPYADVLIDGKLIGEVPPIRILEVEEGKHTIEFVVLGLNKKFTVETEIKAGEDIEIRMNMETGVHRIVKISLKQ